MSILYHSKADSTERLCNISKMVLDQCIHAIRMTKQKAPENANTQHSPALFIESESLSKIVVHNSVYPLNYLIFKYLQFLFFSGDR